VHDGLVVNHRESQLAPVDPGGSISQRGQQLINQGRVHIFILIFPDAAPPADEPGHLVKPRETVGGERQAVARISSQDGYSRRGADGQAVLALQAFRFPVRANGRQGFAFLCNDARGAVGGA